MLQSKLCTTAILGMLIWRSGAIEGVGQPPAPTERPRAVVVEPDYDFGTLEQGQLVTRSFTIRNEGTAPLTISRVDLSQPFMRSRFRRVIPANSEGQITIEWDTTRFTGDLAAEAIVHLDDPAQRRLSLTIQGVVRSPIDVLPSPAVYFSVFRDESAQQTISIVNNDQRPLRIGQLQGQSDRFKADLRTLADGKRYEVAIKVPSGLPAGRYMDVLLVETDHPRRQQLKIGVNIFVKDNLYASPEFVDFGEVRSQELRNPLLNELLRQSFIVKKRRGTFTITGISSSVSGLSIASDPTGASDSFRVDVSLIPAQVQPGSLESTIRIRTDDSDFPELLIPIRGLVR
jgi:Protein of unknown function (DUF1573)